MERCNPRKSSFIWAAPEDLLSWLEGHTKINNLTKKITRVAIAFQYCPVKFDRAYNYAVTFVFEFGLYEHVQGHSRLGNRNVFNFGT